MEPRSASAAETALRYRANWMRVSGVSTEVAGIVSFAGSYPTFSGQGTCGQCVPTNRQIGRVRSRRARNLATASAR